MAKSDKLLEKFGDNMAANAGLTPGKSSLPASIPARAVPAKEQGIQRNKQGFDIELDRIAPDPDQPRKDFPDEEIGELAESLKVHGQLQPALVRWVEESGKYFLIAGERRYRAALKAALKTLRCDVYSGALTPGQVLELQVIENAKRKDLKPIEHARTIRRLIDEFGYTTKVVGDRLGMSQGAVSKALAVLDLPEDVQADVESGAIPKEHAYHLSKVASPEVQREIASKVKSEKLTHGETAEEVRKAFDRPKPKTAKGRGGSKPKLKTEVTHNDSGFKITVVHKKGVDLVKLNEVLYRWRQVLPESA